MKRFFTWLCWTFISCASLLIVAIAGVLIYTQTDGFRRMVQEQALTAVNQKINGAISWDRIEGSFLGNLHIYDLRLKYRDREVFRTARAEVGYSLLPLLWGRVQITHLRASAPWLELRKDADGDWTLVKALATTEPSTDEPSPWTIAIDGIAIENGEMIFEPQAAKPELYRMRRLNLNGSVWVGNGLDARIERLGVWIEIKDAPPIYASGALTYGQTTDQGSLAFEKFWLQTAQSRVMLAGTIRDFERFNTYLQLDIGQLAAADLARFIPQWPASMAVRGQVNMRGSGNALDSTFKLALADAEISGALRADVLSETKPYSGDVAVRSLEIAKLLPHKDVAGVVSADVKIAGAAANADSIKGSGTVSVRSAVVNQTKLGEITLQGHFSPKIADFTGALNGPLAEASWRSRLVLATQPEYRIELTVPSLNAARLLQLSGPAPAEVSFKATVEGSGFDLKAMNTRADVDLLQSQLGGVTVQQGKVLARISQGRVRIQHAQLQATGASLQVRGDLGVDLNNPGRLDYRLEVSNLTPWLDLAHLKGSGRLELAGNASGNLARLQTRGALSLREVNLAEFTAESGRVLFTLERKKDAPLPEGNLNLELVELRAGVQLARLQAAIKLPPPGTQAVAVSASARDLEGRSHRLVAEVEHQTATLLVRAKEFVLALPDGSWRLAEPATITRSEEDFSIDELVLRNRNQTLAVSGRFSLSGAQALNASVDGLSLDALKSFSPKAPDITGNVSARLQIRGIAAAPVIEARAELTDSKIAGQSYGGMRAFTRYQNKRIAVDLKVEQDSSHSLEVHGTIPLALSWDRGWRAEPVGSMEMRARSAGLSLAFLNAFKPAALQNINGEIALDVALRGTFSDPEPRGTFELRDGAFEVKALGSKLTAVSVQGSADTRRISLSRLSARAGSGTIDGSGVIALKQFAPENIDLTISARRWPALQTEQYRGTVNGDIKVAGAPSALRIAGTVEVIEGTIRPALRFLDRGPVALKRDPTIVVVEQRGAAPILVEPNGKSAAAENSLLQNLALQVTVTITNNLWVRHANANLELNGKITIIKKPETDVTLSGLLEIVRGWVGFQGRRFTLTEGRIQFTGGKPTDAILQLAAEYRVNNYLVNAIVNGTADKPTLSLQSQPVLQQSDILSLLLFGRPVADLTNTEQVSLQQSAIDVTAGFAAATVGRAVADALGLENLGIDLSDVSFTGGQVRFGRYVGARTYVSVSQAISGNHGREVGLEYQLAPHWRVGASTTIEGNSGFDVIWHKRY